MSDIDSNRSKFSGPLSPMMRPRCAMEEGAPYYVEQVQPSIPDESLGARVTRIANQSESEMSRVDLLRAVVAQLMNRLGLTCIVLESFELECGPRAEVRPEAVGKTTTEKRYFVQVPAVKGAK